MFKKQGVHEKICRSSYFCKEQTTSALHKFCEINFLPITRNSLLRRKTNLN